LNQIRRGGKGRAGEKKNHKEELVGFQTRRIFAADQRKKRGGTSKRNRGGKGGAHGGGKVARHELDASSPSSLREKEEKRGEGGVGEWEKTESYYVARNKAASAVRNFREQRGRNPSEDRIGTAAPKMNFRDAAQLHRRPSSSRKKLRGIGKSSSHAKRPT